MTKAGRLQHVNCMRNREIIVAVLLTLGSAFSSSSAQVPSEDTASYTGHDGRGIPHYANRAFTDEERALLRRVYGIEDPTRLYVSDSTDSGVLKYDTQRKTCATCYVNSYRLGFISVRHSGESWEEAERRVRAMPSSAFPSGARIEDTSTGELDPAIRGDVERMLSDAARAGFRVQVVATYRSPQREAFLFRHAGRTHTLTSMHSYGRGIDVRVGDGKLRHRATRARWIAFRRWVSAYRNGEFHILGTPERTWDWQHVEVPTADVGFHDIESAITRARWCSIPGPRACDFLVGRRSDAVR